MPQGGPKGLQQGTLSRRYVSGHFSAGLEMLKKLEAGYFKTSGREFEAVCAIVTILGDGVERTTGLVPDRRWR